MENTLEEINFLKKENDYLKKLLSNMMHKREQSSEILYEEKILTNRSLPSEKIKLIKSLFKSRTDVYAVRFIDRDGKPSYAPAREFNWQGKQNVQSKEKRRLLPLSDQVLFDHLSGKKTIGIYPLFLDETCYFLALDFDKKNWQQDVLAFIQVCKNYNVPVNIERSRSGNGAHVWIFFAEKITATLARKFGTVLLNKALEVRHEIGFDSFDRMFPNQDTLPKGGFGNLIALPLQLESKKAGNSVFVDETFTPFQDQWMYLSSVQKMTFKEIQDILTNTEERETILNQIMPKNILISVRNGLYIQKEGIPSSLLTKIMKLAAFKNPEFYKAQAKRMSTYGLQKVISCWDEDLNHIILPRGCMDELILLLNELSIEVDFRFEQYEGENINVSFNGTLTSQQEDAVNQLFNNENGVLAAAPGFGKTVTAAALIAKRNINTLIIVDRTQLLQQWVASLTTFLSTKEIGQIGGGKRKVTGNIDVATIQSLNSKGELKSFITQYGQIIVDECHHISAFSFEKVLKKVRAKYVHGLTATPIRKDGLHPIIFMQCGPIRYKVDAKSQSKVRPFTHKLIPRFTSFISESTEINEIYHEISTNEQRNQLLFDDVLRELENGRSPIILTERIDHLKYLQTIFKGFAKNIIVLSGNKSKKERRQELERLADIPETEERLIIATGKYIGEGFDDARLDTLFLSMPISWKGTLQQYVGRLHRLHSNKEEVTVYDYVDHKVPILKRMYEKRLKGYKAMGYLVKDNSKNQTEQMRLF